jgi:hypothetical protein
MLKQGIHLKLMVGAGVVKVNGGGSEDNSDDNNNKNKLFIS